MRGLLLPAESTFRGAQAQRRQARTHLETILPTSMNYATTLRLSPAVSGIWRVANMHKLTTSPPTLSKKLFRSSDATHLAQSESA